MSLQIIPYGFGCSTFFILAPEMKQAFGWSYARLGMINAFCQVALITMSYAAIWTTLFLGPRLSMTLSISISTTIFFVLSLISSSLTASVLVVALMGVAPFAWIPLVPFISMSMPPKKQGNVLAIVCSGPPVAMILVSCFAPFIIETSGWRLVWGTTGIISLVILIACLPFLYRIPLDTSTSNNQNAALPVRLTLFFCLITFLNGMGDLPVLTYMGNVLHDRAGLSMSEAGTGWILCGLGGILSGPFLGRILWWGLPGILPVISSRFSSCCF